MVSEIKDIGRSAQQWCGELGDVMETQREGRGRTVLGKI